MSRSADEVLHLRPGVVFIWVSTSKDSASALAALQSERKLKERWAFAGEQLLLVTTPNREDGGQGQEAAIYTRMMFLHRTERATQTCVEWT